MGAFTSPDFVKEFSYRTKINYYTMLRDYSKTASEKENANKVINDIQREMRERNYDISGYYDTTQLINSLIGLLIFPEQVYFNILPDEEYRLETDFPSLYGLVNNKQYKCTYKRHYRNHIFSNCPLERKTPKKLLIHLRNSVAHKHLMIHPQQSRFDKAKRSIDTIVFEDACLYVWDGNQWRVNYKDNYFQNYNGYSYLNYEAKEGTEIAVFHLEVPVEKLELLLMEICDYFVR